MTLSGPIALMQLAAEEDVLGRAEIVAQGQVLVDDLDALAAGISRLLKMLDLVAQADLALRRQEIAGDNLDQRRLAGAVVAHEAQDLAGLDRQVDASQRLDRAKVLSDAPQFQQRQ